MSIVRLPKSQWNNVGRSMAAQVDRVNNEQGNLALQLEHRDETIRQLQHEQSEMQRRLDMQAEYIRKLQAQLTSTETEPAPPPTPVRGGDAMIVNGQRVITVQQALARIGHQVSIATAYRYCDTAHWQCIRQGRRRFVIADQSLTVKSKKSRRS